MLQNHFNVQCQPEMSKTGTSSMKVKKVKKSPYRGANGAPTDISNGYFPHPEDPIQGYYHGPQSYGSSGLTTAMSSLQLYYPQLSPLKQENLYASVMAHQGSGGSKWFDRFFQSTRNLNQTLSALHKKHERKLRSYTATSLSQCDEEVTLNGIEIPKGASRPP